MPTPRLTAGLGAVLSLSLALSACTGDDPEPSPPTPPPTAADPVELSVGVFGSEAEFGAWDDVIRTFTDERDDVEVDLIEWSSHEAAVEALESGKVPDVFMTSQRDLATLLEAEVTRPVGELLDERGVEFGDSFSRDAVAAFGVEGDLQCMAYSVSSMVVYYNESLIDFEVMAESGLDVPDRQDRWSLAEFAAAARFASRPARGISGFHVEPTLDALAPFVVSGGGTVFDQAETPGSLTFSSEESRAALGEALEVLRDPTLTLPDEALEKRSALEWFKRGRLAMITGYRDLVPELREVEGLEFNVLSMPVLDDPATVGRMSGLCMSRETKTPGVAADFITHAVSDEAMARVAQVGAIVPANIATAASDSFLQSEQMPASAGVFNAAVRGIVVAPMITSWPELDEAVAEGLQALLTEPGELDLEQVTTSIDEASRAVLDPESIEQDAPDEDEIPDTEE